MEPIPETNRAFEELGRFTDTDLLQSLRTSSDEVGELVPDCVGLTLAYLQDGLAFTLMATGQDLAVLHAVQYLSGGPCADSMKSHRVLEFHDDDPLDEQRWQHFAQATAAASIRSTLTLPILASGTVVGSVNLYAATGNAFAGRHEEIADIFHAWAPGAVTNADLTFQTRAAAQAAPQRLRDDLDVEMAVGILMARHDLDAGEARRRLADAACRAGVSEASMLAGIIEAGRDRNDGRH